MKYICKSALKKLIQQNGKSKRVGAIIFIIDKVTEKTYALQVVLVSKIVEKDQEDDLINQQPDESDDKEPSHRSNSIPHLQELLWQL